MINYENSLDDFKRNLHKILDLILKYLPSKDAIAYKEKIANLNEQNTELKAELTKMATDTLGFEFENDMKNIAAHFSKVCDRIAKGDKDYTDLLDYCDTDKMIRDFEKKLSKDEPCSAVEMLKKEKPGIEFDKDDKKAICNQLVSRGYTLMIDYFDKDKYIEDCFNKKIDLGVEYEVNPRSGRIYLSNYDYSQMKKVSDAIDECKQYITETINQNEDYSEAYENSVLYVKNNLKQFYLDKNTHIEKSDVSHDNFFIYGNLSLSGFTKGDVSFTYEKDNCHIEVDLSKLEGAVSEEMKDVIYNKCYDMSDLELESIEQERHSQEYEEEIDDDPYGERSLF